MPAEILFANPDNSSFDNARRSVIELCRNRGMRLKIIEGCTGGLLNHSLTMPGATQVISEGATLYSRDAKVRGGIPDELMKQHGEYSPEVAMRMAEIAGKKENTLGVGVVGDLNTINSLTKMATVFVAYAFGRKTLLTPLSIKADNRSAMKHEIALNVLTGINSFINGKEPSDQHPFLGQLVDPLRHEYSSLLKKAEEIITFCKQAKSESTLPLQIGTMESATGLQIASALTDIPGSSEFFSAGMLAYDENVKREFGVPVESMALGGVYSEEVAKKMAEAVIARTGVDIAFATTGVMDVWDTRPHHSSTKPGTVYGAIAVKGMKTITRKLGGVNGIVVATRDIMKINATRELFELFLENFLPNYHPPRESIGTSNPNLIYRIR